MLIGHGVYGKIIMVLIVIGEKKDVDERRRFLGPIACDKFICIKKQKKILSKTSDQEETVSLFSLG